jgi:hypothetical protein
MRHGRRVTLGGLLLLILASCSYLERRVETIPDASKVDLRSEESLAGVGSRSAGCISCHVGQTEPHPDPSDPALPGRFSEKIGCTDCHGGHADVFVAASVSSASQAYSDAKALAHVQPRFPEIWKTSANPVRSGVALEKESWEFVRFVNPSDNRVSAYSCGTTGCHGKDAQNHVIRVQKSMMTHGAMLWEAALYNNGAYPEKRARFGESYSPEGLPQRILTNPPPTKEEMEKKGVLPFLDPLPRFEIGQPSNVLRVFEQGQKKPLAIGNPEPGIAGLGLDDEPGRPENRLSARGYGTLNRTDPVFLNLQRTRLLDPTLNMLGTNDHPGDYRSSGCAACHVVYANDRDYLNELRGGRPEANHSGAWAKYGNGGLSAQADPTIPRDEPGHPIQHLLTRMIPSSQCVTCHMHPGTAVSNTFLGYTWWDLETDGKKFWPEKQVNPTAEDELAANLHNPEGSTAKGKWNDPKFLAESGTPAFNKTLEHMQTGDFHGHGFVFRAVWKKDRKGHLLDEAGQIVPDDDPDRWKKSVHLKDIHLEKGMHCVDCHFTVDSHGDGKLYGELRAATAVKCQDCHGTIDGPTDFVTSGNAGGQDLTQSRTPFGKRFRWEGPRGKPGMAVFQHSTLFPELEWEVPQVRDTIDPASKHYNERSRQAKTMHKDGTWGNVPADPSELAHTVKTVECYTCHTSWVASCFGCHLDMKANKKRDALHFEGATQRNWTSYSFQTIRDDLFMLGKDGSVTGGRTVPVRSSCAVSVGSQNQNRENVYSQQQTVSAEGFSGTAFSPHFPHTTRAKETKTCTSCHVSQAKDNNAIMAQVLMQGTKCANFLGRFVYVAGGAGGLEAVPVTERTEPQAVIGSRLHELAYPDNWKAHVAGGKELGGSFHHEANSIAGIAVPLGGDEILSVQLRGEYLYAACGSGGLRVYDVAEIDQKGFSERITTAPVSPLGQRLAVSTRYATSVKAPTTQGVDPARNPDRSARPENQEQRIHPLYAYLYVTDREEGLILVNAATLLDGNPDNNFLERAVTFNPGGILDGAVNCTVCGTNVYVCCDRGIVVVSVADPLKPVVVARATGPKGPRSIQVQFRYAFVCDQDGLTVLDVTDLSLPGATGELALKTVAQLPMKEANAIYVVRTYGYVAAGKQGLVIVDLERPEAPRVELAWNAGGAIDDARDVKVGITNASLFAYVADGKNGLRVVQLTSGDDPGAQGFSPDPHPALVATAPVHGLALAISEGLDRDRAVDESGNQTGVFNRIGSRPLNLEEQLRMYVRNGQLFTVEDAPPGPPIDFNVGGAAISVPGPAVNQDERPGRPGRPARPGGPKPTPKPETPRPETPNPEAPKPETPPARPGRPGRPGAPPRPGGSKPAPAAETPPSPPPAPPATEPENDVPGLELPPPSPAPAPAPAEPPPPPAPEATPPPPPTPRPGAPRRPGAPPPKANPPPPPEPPASGG